MALSRCEDVPREGPALKSGWSLKSGVILPLKHALRNDRKNSKFEVINLLDLRFVDSIEQKNSKPNFRFS